MENEYHPQCPAVFLMTNTLKPGAVSVNLQFWPGLLTGGPSGWKSDVWGESARFRMVLRTLRSSAWGAACMAFRPGVRAVNWQTIYGLVRLQLPRLLIFILT